MRPGLTGTFRDRGRFVSSTLDTRGTGHVTQQPSQGGYHTASVRRKWAELSDDEAG